MNSICEPNFIPFFYTFFKECAYDSYDGLSILSGYISILFWINVLFPQLLENYYNKSVESISYGFLLLWFLGDTTNLVGSILTNQLPFQVYLAMYFVLMDILTVIQCIYYNHFYQPVRHPRYNYHNDCPTLIMSLIPRRITTVSNWKSKLFLCILLSGIILIILFQFFWNDINNDIPPITLFFQMNHFNINFISDDKIAKIGRIISWCCTIFYILSRFPQIYKNYKRQSIEGLSLYMFFFAFMGNFTYTLSIVLRSKLNLDKLYNSLPFILGSAGTMWADIILFYQFLIYKNNNLNYSILSNIEEGDSIRNKPLSPQQELDQQKASIKPKAWQIQQSSSHNEQSGFISENNSYMPSFSSAMELSATPIQLKLKTTHHNSKLDSEI